MSASRNTYGPGHEPSQVKHHEWRTAENSTEYLIPRLKSMAEQNPKLELLDIGAGSGTITASLAKYMPEGHLTATDISDDILHQAKHHAESKGVTNISFKNANVFELPFPDASFDITHAHQVLCHLDLPTAAIKEMLRVTKPGGIVALREGDMRMWCWWPDLPGLRQFHDIVLKTLAATGGQIEAGRELLSWVLEAGASRADVELSMGTWCYSKEEDKRAWGTSRPTCVLHIVAADLSQEMPCWRGCAPAVSALSR